ncbi:hypothetical protein H4582DRAFT_1279431 [Lactarius indigo]|nr:hypothetical protein H4582DRAFT_1279431 [Lactarius indigo]
MSWGSSLLFPIMRVYVPLLLSASSLFTTAMARTFTVYNACPFTIWPALFTDLNVDSATPNQATGCVVSFIVSTTTSGPGAVSRRQPMCMTRVCVPPGPRRMASKESVGVWCAARVSKHQGQPWVIAHAVTTPKLAHPAFTSPTAIVRTSDHASISYNILYNHADIPDNNKKTTRTFVDWMVHTLYRW